MTTQPLVSILLVTYNSEKYIANCLRSVLASAYWPIEVVVVDNLSTDHTIKIINQVKKEYPKVPLQIQKQTTNLGYAEGNNQAAKLAEGKYLFMLNPDTVVDAHFLIDLVATLESNPKIAVAQPAVYLLKNTQQLNLTGKQTSYLGFDWIKNYQKKELPNSEKIYSFSGSGFLISKELFLEAGGFDSYYFMYYEDTDLSWKLQLMGYQIQFINTSVLYHDYKYEPDDDQQSLNQKMYFTERNRVVTLLKNYSVKSLLIVSPVFLLLEISLCVFAFISGWGNKKLQSYLAIFRNWSLIQHQRQFIQNKRVVADSEIFKTMQQGITFALFDHPILKYLLNPLFTLYYQIALLII